jgi:hypothetical protein
VVALASHELHPADMPVARRPREDSGHAQESMWDYSSPNTSRMFGDNGFLGR